MGGRLANNDRGMGGRLAMNDRGLGNRTAGNRNRVVVYGSTEITKLFCGETFSSNDFITDTGTCTPVNFHSVLCTILKICVETVLEPIRSDLLSRGCTVLL